jgi:plasmid maintenance system antidote protein VapI
VRGERAISADTALRLGTYFGLPAQFWLNLQNDYDLRIASRNGAAERIKPRAQSASLASAARSRRLTPPILAAKQRKNAAHSLP